MGGVGDDDVRRPGGEGVAGLRAKHLVAALGRAVARAGGDRPEEARGCGEIRAPAPTLGPLPRLGAARHRVAGALPEVAGLRGAEGPIVVDVARTGQIAEPTPTPGVGVGQAVAVALVGDAGVGVVAVDIEAAEAEAVAVPVPVDAAGLRSVRQGGRLDEIRGAVAPGAGAVAGVHPRGAAQRDGDPRVLEPDQRAVAAATRERQQRCQHGRGEHPADIRQIHHASNRMMICTNAFKVD